MKTLLAILFLVPALLYGQGTVKKGQVIVERINAATLVNGGGENPTRRVTVYLPPGYSETTGRYPVIYYLHGFTWSDSLMIAYDHFDVLLDKAINTGRIRPMIVVLPDQYTLYRGSMYVNSSLTGNWADFTAKELTAFIDGKYRTIANKESRGVTGHSMGGLGSLRLGMMFPDVFSSVYALSPGAIAFVKEIGAASPAYKEAANIKSREELVKTFFPNVVVAIGRAYSPNPNRPPFFADLPYEYEGDKLIVNDRVLELWNKNSPFYMVDQYEDNLRKLKALKLDWGRNEQFAHIPMACMMLSQKLENLGINHYAEEYIGNHGNKLWTDDGRALNDMLPFFNTYLTFEEPTPAATGGKSKKMK